jgi:hypothetical protein
MFSKARGPDGEAAVKLSPTELTHLRSQGLYVAEKCGGCATLLNQSLRLLPIELQVHR